MDEKHTAKAHFSENVLQKHPEYECRNMHLESRWNNKSNKTK